MPQGSMQRAWFNPKVRFSGACLSHFLSCFPDFPSLQCLIKAKIPPKGFTDVFFSLNHPRSLSFSALITRFVCPPNILTSGSKNQHGGSYNVTLKIQNHKKMVMSIFHIHFMVLTPCSALLDRSEVSTRLHKVCS